MERIAERFEAGARFVDLSALRDAGLVVPTIASTFGIHDAASQPVLRLLLQALRTRATLLVLDNFEQLLEAAAELAELLSACRDVRLLVTSREPLGSRWEHLYVVPSLAAPRFPETPGLPGDGARRAGRGAVPRACSSRR